MSDSTYKEKVYLKLIDYKRSVGITQWTVLSIFITTSEAVFVFGLKQTDGVYNRQVLIFAVMIYWLGFLLYRRYRRLNMRLSNYLIKLEEELDIDFQQHMEKKLPYNKRFVN